MLKDTKISSTQNKMRFSFFLWKNMKRWLFAILTTVVLLYIPTELSYSYFYPDKIPPNIKDDSKLSLQNGLKNMALDKFVCSFVYNVSIGHNVPAHCVSATRIPPLCVKRINCGRKLREPKRNDVSLVTQLSFKRINMLKKLLSCNWTGYIVSGIYLKQHELKNEINLERITKLCAKHVHMTLLIVHSLAEDSHYPVNVMRTLVARESPTQFMFHMDVDFRIPNKLHSLLVSYLNPPKSENLPISDSMSKISLENRAFVVPAFETKSLYLRLPQNKMDLIQNAYIKTFHSYYTPAQSSTLYWKWNTSHDPYVLKRITPGYEPWVMVHKSAPKPDIRFSGRNLNKVAFIYQLIANKYVFTVLPDVFMLHYPHTASPDKKHPDHMHYKCTLEIYRGLKKEIRSERLNRTIVKENARKVILHRKEIKQTRK